MFKHNIFRALHLIKSSIVQNYYADIWAYVTVNNRNS